MAIIHVARHQQTLGSFSEEEIREGIRSGRFTLEDLVWQEGMETWKPLGEMAPQWGVDKQLDDLSVEKPLTNPFPATEVGEDGSEPAWEDREKVGFFPAISKTLVAVLMHPAETFAKMKHEGGMATPLLFFIILYTAASAVTVLYQTLSGSAAVTLAAELHQLAPNLPAYQPRMDSFILLGALLISPAIYVVSAFLFAGIIHLFLQMMGGANRSFETTFRVVCYARGSNAVFTFLPLFGGLIGLIWGSYCIIIGLKEAHGTSLAKAVLAVILPCLVCCVVPAIFIVGSVAATLAKAGGLPQ